MDDFRFGVVAAAGAFERRSFLAGTDIWTESDDSFPLLSSLYDIEVVARRLTDCRFESAIAEEVVVHAGATQKQALRRIWRS